MCSWHWNQITLSKHWDIFSHVSGNKPGYSDEQSGRVQLRFFADNIRIFLERHSDIFELFDKTKPGVLSQNSACLKQQHGTGTTSNWKLSLKNRKVLPKRIITHQQAQLFWQHVNLNPGEFRQTDHRVDVVIRWRRTGGINRSRMRSGAFR